MQGSRENNKTNKETIKYKTRIARWFWGDLEYYKKRNDKNSDVSTPG